MRAPLLLAIAAAGLAGCATGPFPASLAGSYACRPQDGPGTGSVAHVVTVTPDSRARSIQAVVDARPAQALALVEDGRVPLFASDRFAWRPQADAGTLTDIRSVQTFACAREASANDERPPSSLRRSRNRG